MGQCMWTTLLLVERKRVTNMTKISLNKTRNEDTFGPKCWHNVPPASCLNASLYTKNIISVLRASCLLFALHFPTCTGSKTQTTELHCRNSWWSMWWNPIKSENQKTTLGPKYGQNVSLKCLLCIVTSTCLLSTSSPPFFAQYFPTAHNCTHSCQNGQRGLGNRGYENEIWNSGVINW